MENPDLIKFELVYYIQNEKFGEPLLAWIPEPEYNSQKMKPLYRWLIDEFISQRFESEGLILSKVKVNGLVISAHNIKKAPLKLISNNPEKLDKVEVWLDRAKTEEFESREGENDADDGSSVSSDNTIKRHMEDCNQICCPICPSPPPSQSCDIIPSSQLTQSTQKQL